MYSDTQKPTQPTQTTRCLCTIIGESFRSGGRLSRTVGQEGTLNEQHKAVMTHIRFIKSIEKKYNISIDVIVHTVYTKFINDVYKWYSSEINLIGFIVIPQGIGLTDSLRACLRLCKYNDFKFYKSVISFRIDLYLREFIDSVFDPLSNSITYAWYSTSFDSNEIKVNDQFMCFPQGLFKKVNYNEDMIKISHGMRDYYHNIYNKSDKALIYTQHTSETSNGWNPLFYIINRKENTTWRARAIYNRQTIEHIPYEGFTNRELDNIKLKYSEYHEHQFINYKYTKPTVVTLQREECGLTKERELIILHTFKEFPISSSCVRQARLKDITTDMVVGVGKQYGIIQLLNLLPLDLNYSLPHNSGVVGRVWEEHHQCFANFIQKFNPTSVLEIGGGHGILSTFFNDIQWCIVDPHGIKNAKSKSTIIRQFFDKTFHTDIIYDTIVHSHTIEHIYDIQEFLEIQCNSVQLGQRLIFSIPNLKEMFKRCFLNSITFEHTILIEEDTIEQLLNQIGLQLEEKHYFKEAHSIFYCFKKVSVNTNTDKLTLVTHYDENVKLVSNFIEKTKKDCNAINIKIQNTKNVYIFGAHVFTQFLINIGLETANIVYVIDNDADKHNKRLYGTDLFVRSPQCLANAKDATVILFAGNYTEEVKIQLYTINEKLTIISYEDVN